MESTASIERDELRAEVGAFLGYGRGSVYGETAWTSIQERAIDSCVKSGLHRFYFPPPLPGERVSHEWTFLKPTATLALASGASAVDLPNDYGGLTGQISVATPTGKRWEPVAVIGSADVERRLDADDATGAPRYAAQRPKKGTGRDRGQRWELVVYPAADQAYTLRLAYTVAPDALTAANPYPYGGPVHRETVLESCLAVAEKRLDDEATVHHQEFMLHLAASVSHDRKFRPQHLGYNGNGPGTDPAGYRFDSVIATVAGMYTPAE